MKIKELKKNNQGMTLVEIIISIALLGIISMMVLTVLTSGVLLAAKSGDNTKVTGNAGGVLENVLGGSNITADGTDLKVEGVKVGTGVYSENNAVTATIVFDGGSAQTIDGTFYTVDSNSDRNDTTMKVFVPE